MVGGSTSVGVMPAFWPCSACESRPIRNSSRQGQYAPNQAARPVKKGLIIVLRLGLQRADHSGEGPRATQGRAWKHDVVAAVIGEQVREKVFVRVIQFRENTLGEGRSTQRLSDRLRSYGLSLRLPVQQGSGARPLQEAKNMRVGRRKLQTHEGCHEWECLESAELAAESIQIDLQFWLN